ncbi:MAG: type I-MYXAN CRISPR-associated Cas8a1/Cmx1 [Gammaproteobacteria bacterium]
MEKLVCDLFLPGMTPLHRADLGGLASTLRWIEKHAAPGDHPPGCWKVGERSITFEWKSGEERQLLFDRLFSFAYKIEDGLIYLPGQYCGLAPSLEVRAALQEGLLLSFYDHGPTSRGKDADTQVRTYEVDDKAVSFRFLPLAWYKHQRDGASLFLQALEGDMEVTRTLFPGAIERHAGITGTRVTCPAPLALPLLFAPVGVLALKAGGKRVNDRGQRKFKPGAALLVPDFHNLSTVHYLLPALLPRSAQDCQVGNVADAALQAELRLRSKALLDPTAISAIRRIWCCPTDWNSRLQPPSFVTDIAIEAVNPRLDQFEIAMQALSPPAPRMNTKTGDYFWPRSYVRPLVAENLASGKPWYKGFARLMIAQDPLNNKPIRDYLIMEKRGLHAMTQEISWDSSGEELMVRAVHEALRCRYGRIAAENMKNPAAMKNRMSGEYERLRLAFSGAKTADLLRHALADLWSRAGPNEVLREAWPQALSTAHQ